MRNVIRAGARVVHQSEHNEPSIVIATIQLPIRLAAVNPSRQVVR